MSDTEPRCEACGQELVCKGCADLRPEAGDVTQGWTVRTPFGQWEMVVRVERPEKFGPVFIYTQAHPDFGWQFNRWSKIDAMPPRSTWTGKPEVRIIDDVHSVRMYVVATVDTVVYAWEVPDHENVLVEAGNAGRGNGWWVYTQGDPDRKEGLTKAQARSEIRRRGREFAKRLKVPLRVAGD